MKRTRTTNDVSNNSTVLTEDIFYSRFVERTAHECKTEIQAKQRSNEWLEARRYCLTASVLALAIDDSERGDSSDLIDAKVNNKLRSKSEMQMMQWGINHESDARVAFSVHLPSILAAEGSTDIKMLFSDFLYKSEQCPWFAGSPDDVVSYKDKNGNMKTDVIEYKCPPNTYNTLGYRYDDGTINLDHNVPRDYKAQVMSLMGYMRAYHNEWKPERSWFVVWQSNALYITHIPFDQDFYDNAMAKAQLFYRSRLLKAFVKQYNGEEDILQHQDKAARIM